MEPHIRLIKERTLDYCGVRWHGELGIDDDFEFTELADCQNTGHHPNRSMIVADVCFKTNRQIYGDSIPFEAWISLGKPSQVLRTDQIVYTPKNK